MTDSEIGRFVEELLVLENPSNTQFVERLVQIVSSHGKSAADPQLREGFAKAKLTSQKEIPKVSTNKAHTANDASS